MRTPTMPVWPSPTLEALALGVILTLTACTSPTPSSGARPARPPVAAAARAPDPAQQWLVRHRAEYLAILRDGETDTEATAAFLEKTWPKVKIRGALIPQRFPFGFSYAEEVSTGLRFASSERFARQVDPKKDYWLRVRKMDTNENDFLVAIFEDVAGSPGRLVYNEVILVHGCLGI